MSDKIIICDICQKAYEAEKIRSGVRKLKTFHGYTVDLRLQEFRKVEYGKQIQFIPFNSPEGENLLSQMHESILN